MAELRVTGKTKFAILECKKFLQHLFLSRYIHCCKSSLRFVFLKSHPPRARTELFLPPAEIIGISWHFGSFSFLAKGQRQRHLVKFWVEIQFRLQEQCVGYMIRFIWPLWHCRKVDNLEVLWRVLQNRHLGRFCIELFNLISSWYYQKAEKNCRYFGI